MDVSADLRAVAVLAAFKATSAAQKLSNARLNWFFDAFTWLSSERGGWALCSCADSSIDPNLP
jgi:hypothetical protein